MPLPSSSSASTGTPGLGSSGGIDLSASAIASLCYIDLGGTPSDIDAKLTLVAREYLARSIVEGLRFKVVGFQVGSGGFDTSNPSQALVVDNTATRLSQQFFPDPLADPNFEPIDQVAYPNATGVAFLCRAAAGEAIALWGELCLVAEITASPLDSDEVGTIFTFAIMHEPMQSKTGNHVFNRRIVVQFGE